MMPPAVATMIAVGAASLWVETAGTGPAVVFLHAGVADSRMWNAEFAALQTTHRVVRLDLRGFGESQLVPGEFAYYEDVVAVMDTLHIDRATLVGCSFGSNIALDVALTHSRRVDRLVLVAPSLGDGSTSPPIRAFEEAEESALERGDMDAATELNLRTWVDGPHRKPNEVDPAVRRLVGAMQRRAFENPMPETVKIIRLDPPARDRLRSIKVPTLVVVGSIDQDHVLGVARRLREEIPGSRLEIIKGAAHLPSLESPARWLEMLKSFVSP